MKIFARLGILGVLSFAVSVNAWAYPENIRYGYINCTTCHVSPTGGGILTPYGRSLSAEISTWGSESEAQFLYGAVKLPTWLNAGGDFRGVQTWADTPTYTQGMFIRMQSDLEAQVTIGKLSLVASGGFGTGQVPTDFWSGSFFSREHYALYQATDNLALRAGKFEAAYGVNEPNHVWLIKRDLGWGDEGSETYNIEASWIAETFNVYLTGIFGNPGNNPTDNNEKGGSMVVSVSPFERFKGGFSFLHGSTDAADRNLIGPFVLYAFTPKLFLISECDFQFLAAKAAAASNAPPPSYYGGLGQPTYPNSTGFANSNELGYEVYKGVVPFALIEMSRLQFSDDTTMKEYLGGGIQLYPRPHFDFEFVYQRQRIAALGPDYWQDYSYLMLHYYF
jgi:hypothetical protein